MAKYKVYTYYTYMAVSEVEANSPEEAFGTGYNNNEGLFTDDLEFVGCTDNKVVDENGEIYTF